MVSLVLHAAANDGILWLSKLPTKVLKRVGLLVRQSNTLQGGYRSMLWVELQAAKLVFETEMPERT